MNLFVERLKNAVDNDLQFVLFRKPNEDLVYLYVQENSGEHRFLMHTFDSKTEKVITTTQAVTISAKEFNFDFELKLENAKVFESLDQQKYQDLIQKTVTKIKSNQVRKIVMSRLKQVDNQNFHIFKSYKNLLDNHASAMVFLWHNPNRETWIGATPELLLSQNGNQINTVSLAATKLPEASWTEKEFDEQRIVTDYILDCFSGIQKIEVNGPETVQAGKFQHLKSYIFAEVEDGFQMGDLLENMHPTPALCGFPKKEAFEFIIQNEAYPREFYGGYLGIENKESKSYFVNLRSAQIFQDKIWIYVGGGITADSDPKKEWQETELKSGTILNALVKN